MNACCVNLAPTMVLYRWSRPLRQHERGKFCSRGLSPQRLIAPVAGAAPSRIARASLYRDFLFIPAYVAFLAALFTLLLRLVDLSPASMCRLYLALGLAGLLDTVENIVLSSSLPLMPSWDTTLVAGIAASLKFLLLAGVVAILVAIVVDVCVDHFKS